MSLFSQNTDNHRINMKRFVSKSYDWFLDERTTNIFEITRDGKVKSNAKLHKRKVNNTSGHNKHSLWTLSQHS